MIQREKGKLIEFFRMTKYTTLTGNYSQGGVMLASGPTDKTETTSLKQKDDMILSGLKTAESLLGASMMPGMGQNQKFRSRAYTEVFDDQNEDMLGISDFDTSKIMEGRETTIKEQQQNFERQIFRGIEEVLEDDN